MDKAKVRTVAVYETTFRKIFTKTKPINSLADMKGLKIRVPEAQNYVRCMQFLGANPTPVPWGELYTALKIINEAGHELHAKDPEASARFNLSILYRRGPSSAPSPAQPGGKA